MNHVMLVGVVGKTPEVRKGKKGGDWCVIDLGCRHQEWRDGAMQAVTTWMKITAFGRVALEAGTLRTGDLVGIAGSLRNQPKELSGGIVIDNLSVVAQSIITYASVRDAGAGEVDSGDTVPF